MINSSVHPFNVSSPLTQFFQCPLSVCDDPHPSKGRYLFRESRTGASDEHEILWDAQALRNFLYVLGGESSFGQHLRMGGLV